MAENKVTYGLTNVHYAVESEDDTGNVTYGTPVPFPGAVELTLEPRGESTEFYADNTLYYQVTANQGYEGTFTSAGLPKNFRVDVLGDTLDADGILTENSNAKPKKVTWLFEFDGDVKATRHVLYNSTVSRPGFGSTTKNETAEPGTSELTFINSPRADGVVKRSTTAETPAEVYETWYSEVFEPRPLSTP